MNTPNEEWTEPTACFEATTRSEKLAQDIIELASRHGEDPTIVTVGMEPIEPEHGQAQWGEALNLAATRGARIEIYLGAWASKHETSLASEIARRHPQQVKVRELRWAETLSEGPLAVFLPTVAWSGPIEAPTAARLWLENLREDGEATTGVEYRTTENLARNPGMATFFVNSVRETALTTH